MIAETAPLRYRLAALVTEHNLYPTRLKQYTDPEGQPALRARGFAHARRVRRAGMERESNEILS